MSLFAHKLKHSKSSEALQYIQEKIGKTEVVIHRKYFCAMQNLNDE